VVDFSLWDILRNLLLAARWTVALSLVAFVGGALLGLNVSAWMAASVALTLYSSAMSSASSS
jgi:polar amino acid transport system permease protein